MSDKDSLDVFFDQLDENEYKDNQHGNDSLKDVHFSSESDTDPEEKSSHFLNPIDATVQDEEQNGKDGIENEPIFVMAPDHSKIHYPPYISNKMFPELQSEINKELQNPTAIHQWQLEKDVLVTTSFQELPPIHSFQPFQLVFPSLSSYLKEMHINEPTPVQSQVLPMAITGQNLVVVSPTGTGKTLCFLIPLILHLQAQGARSVQGPRALILSPTEILAHQTAEIFKKLTKGLVNEAKNFEELMKEISSQSGKDNSYLTPFTFLELSSGQFKFKQSHALLKFPDVIIATPGRLISLLEDINWNVLTYLVVDEADKIFASGFFGQLRCILEYIRPDKQTLLFGATLPSKIEELSKNSLKHPVRIQIGRTGAPQSNIDHNFHFFDKPTLKKAWLVSQIQNDKFPKGLILIFVNNGNFAKKLFEDISSSLPEFAPCFHYVTGYSSNQERASVFNEFKKHSEYRNKYLICTDVVARGIDIGGIEAVVNYDIPELPENYIHRVGRTGRAGRNGIAYTLLSISQESDYNSAKSLIKHFQLTGAEPPKELVDFVFKIPHTFKEKFSFDF